MKKVVFLEYAFIFEAGTTFDNIYDFENVLAEVFKVNGCQAEVLDTVRGNLGRRIVYITRMKDMLDDPTLASKEKPGEEKEAEQKIVEIGGEK